MLFLFLLLLLFFILSGNTFEKKIRIFYSIIVPVAQWLKHYVSSAKVVGSIPR